MTAAAPLLRLDAVDVFRGRAQILTGVSLELGRGEVLALMGRNGAGKSTTLKTVIGLLRPAAGNIAFAGRRIDGAAPSAISRLGIGYVPEERRIFTDLTVMENLMVGLQPRRPDTPCWTPDSLFALFPNLAELRRRRADAMSGGEQQMLAIARTLMGNPALLLLDEPSQGLAPKILGTLAETVLRLKAQGLAILLAEQNLRFAARIADRAAIIERGAIRYAAGFAALMQDEPAQRRYLGA